MSKIYLSAFNLISAYGWAYILLQLFSTLSKNNNDIFESGSQFWDAIKVSLPLVQTFAFLEIIHSILGLVRSPLLPTIVQVGSRLGVVWLCLVPTNGVNGHWSLYLCVGSWSLVEIPRYLFYLFSVNLKGEPHKIPSIIFFLRYHLFLVLYPSGILGELLIAYNAYGNDMFHHATTFFGRVLTILLLLYVPGSPFMMQNMWRMKSMAYKKRKQLEDASKVGKKKSTLNGLIWPVTDESTQDRSTTKTNKAIWAASVANVDTHVLDQIQKERNWRFGYAKHVLKNALVSCASKKDAIKVAKDGLAAAYDRFEFMRDGRAVSFQKAMSGAEGEGLFRERRIYETHVIKGNFKKSVKEAEVPYGGGKYQGQPYYLGKHDNTVISGIQLVEQLKKWVDYGTIEPSAADAINLVNLQKNEWLDLSNHYFILLGATSAMGPLYFLLKHGANVIAVDLDRDFIWKKLFEAVRDSPGTLIFPVKKEKLVGEKGKKSLSNLSDLELAPISGCNLLCDTPEIANWLIEDVIKNNSIIKKNDYITIGNYTYLDGALHVQLSLACDGIISRVCNERKNQGQAENTAVAFLCTPTDDHIVPEEAYLAAKSNYEKEVPMWASLINTMTGGKFLGVPNYKAMKQINKSKLYVVDGIAVAQGPNYALAKRMQHWRAVIAHSEGITVSSNVAPSTATMSVVHNAQFAAAYGGMHLFRPMEVMYQRTSLAVMGLLLIHDVRNKDYVSNPNSKAAKQLENPLELITHGSFHGGVWRCSYKVDKIGVPSALAYYVSTNVPAIVAGIAGLVSGGSWLATGKFVPGL